MTTKKQNTNFIIIISLIIIILVFVFGYFSLLNKYNKLNNEKNELFIEKNQLLESITDLNNNHNQLKLESLNKSQKIENLSNDYNNLSGEYTTLMDEIEVFKTQIEDSMNWFKTNATLENIKDSARMKDRLHTCVSCDGDFCNIKTACIVIFVNDKKFNLQYLFDENTTQSDDKLQSLDSFIANKGGDCEDYSLLFTAELRYLIDYVITEKKKIPIIEAIIESDTSKDYAIYGDWYYDDGIAAYNIESEYIYPYVACGYLYDPQIKESGGHCLIMLTTTKISDYSDIRDIENVKLIEPQTGFYVGEANSVGLLELNNEGGYISEIITDCDYYLHTSKLFETEDYYSDDWYNYGYYLNKINNLT